MTSAPMAVLRTALRVLSFRASREELLELDHRHLVFGLVATWLVGIGRYWDSPRATLFQKAGLGSVVYVLVLSCFLWLVLWPLRPRSWSWVRLLTFVTLVSPPAALYAIPVEMFTRLETAQTLNATFLAIVAVWRVALLVWFLRRVADLSVLAVVVGSLLPLVAIVTALALLNLEHVMFDLMSGIRPENRSSADTAYSIVFMLTWVSWMALPVLAVAYVALTFVRVRAWLREQELPVPAEPVDMRAAVRPPGSGEDATGS